MPEFGINPGDAGNRRGINFFVCKHQDMSYHRIVHKTIEPATKYCMQTAHIDLKLCEYVCTPKRNIGLISHVQIHAWHFFLDDATGIFVCCPVYGYI